MRVISKEFFNYTRTKSMTIVPLGDMHIGAAACNEKKIKDVVSRIEDDENCYWIAMGDYCLSSDTQILTDDGWQDSNSISQAHRVVVYNPQSGEASLEKTEKLWINEVDGQLVNIKSGHVDVLVTKNHRVLVNKNRKRKGWSESFVVDASQLLKGEIKHRWRVPVACNGWLGDKIELDVNWFKLKGWIDTEGSIEIRGSSCRLQLSQSEKVNLEKVIAMECIFAILDLTPHRSTRDDGVVLWRFNAEQTRHIQNTIGQKCDYVSKMMNAETYKIQAYFDTLMDGDGTRSRNCFAQKEKPLVEIFQELCFKLGYRAKITQVSNVWYCHYGEKRGRHSLIREVEEQAYTGQTWCVTTKTGYIVTKRNDKIVVLGNCDFITPSDPRNNSATLASWIKVKDLGNLPTAQKERFLDIIKPIASKCLCVLSGNHETAIAKHYERDIYSEIVTEIKHLGGFDPEYKLGMGYNGWLILKYYRSEDKNSASKITINLHHGYGGGRLAGAKALNMQRWLWTHECDLAIQGHTHVTQVQAEAYQKVRSNKVVQDRKIGVISGSFLESFNADGPSTYSEVSGYLPTPTGTLEVLLTPGSSNLEKRIRVIV